MKRIACVALALVSCVRLLLSVFLLVFFLRFLAFFRSSLCAHVVCTRTGGAGGTRDSRLWRGREPRRTGEIKWLGSETVAVVGDGACTDGEGVGGCVREGRYTKHVQRTIDRFDSIRRRGRGTDRQGERRGRHDADGGGAREGGGMCSVGSFATLSSGCSRFEIRDLRPATTRAGPGGWHNLHAFASAAQWWV